MFSRCRNTACSVGAKSVSGQTNIRSTVVNIQDLPTARGWSCVVGLTNGWRPWYLKSLVQLLPQPLWIISHYWFSTTVTRDISVLWHNGVYGWRLLTVILKGLKTIIYLLLIHYLHSDSGAADGYKNQKIDRIHLGSVFLQLLLCSTKQAQVSHTQSVNCEYIYIYYLIWCFCFSGAPWDFCVVKCVSWI